MMNRRGMVRARLLSPEFRAAMERNAHESCAAYYANAQVLWIRVLRILRLGTDSCDRNPILPAGRVLDVRAQPADDQLASGRDCAWRPVADR